MEGVRHTIDSLTLSVLPRPVLVGVGGLDIPPKPSLGDTDSIFDALWFAAPKRRVGPPNDPDKN